jgi:hypothetical protein
VTYGDKTDFYDEKGRRTGTAIRRGDGSTNFYDENGRSIGRSTR